MNDNVHWHTSMEGIFNLTDNYVLPNDLTKLMATILLNDLYPNFLSIEFLPPIHYSQKKIFSALSFKELIFDP
jgi:hypothetical protein